MGQSFSFFQISGFSFRIMLASTIKNKLKKNELRSVLSISIILNGLCKIDIIFPLIMTNSFLVDLSLTLFNSISYIFNYLMKAVSYD